MTGTQQVIKRQCSVKTSFVTLAVSDKVIPLWFKLEHISSQAGLRTQHIKSVVF